MTEHDELELTLKVERMLLAIATNPDDAELYADFCAEAGVDGTTFRAFLRHDITQSERKLCGNAGFRM